MTETPCLWRRRGRSGRRRRRRRVSKNKNQREGHEDDGRREDHGWWNSSKALLWFLPPASPLNEKTLTLRERKEEGTRNNLDSAAQLSFLAPPFARVPLRGEGGEGRRCVQTFCVTLRLVSCAFALPHLLLFLPLSFLPVAPWCDD